MLILTLRTDKPEAEVGLYNDEQQIVYREWQAHRQLAETLHTTIATMLTEHQYAWGDIEGIVVYQGPGSFTGLRIGITVANTVAQSVGANIVGSQHDSWISDGIARLLANETDTIVLTEYGAPVHITAQKK